MRISLLLTLLLLSFSSMLGNDLCYGLSGDTFSGFGLNRYGYNYSAAIEVPETVAKSLVNSEVTEVSVGFHSGLAKTATIFLTYDLTEAPFYEQSLNNMVEGEYNSCPLTIPYVIEGKKFYIGYVYHAASKTGTPIGFDKTEGIGNKSFAYLKSWPDNGEGEWVTVPELGVLALKAIICGDNLPETGAVAKSISLPDGVGVDRDFSYFVTVKNLSIKPLKNINVHTWVDDEEVQSEEIILSEPMAPGEERPIEVIALTYHESDDLNVKTYLVKANGVDNPWSDNYVADKCVSSNFLFPRTVVAEEFTGTGCGYCPRGLYSLEILSKKYPDTFIPIEVQNYNDSDPMYCSTYSEWCAEWVYGAPTTVFDRKMVISPDPSSIDEYYKAEAGMVSYSLEADSEYTNENYNDIKVKTSATFGATYSNHNMALSFVIIENNVGPYMQTNYYADSSKDMGGWEDLSEHVLMTYNNVARKIIDWKGRENTLPNYIEKGETIVYETVLPFKPADSNSDINVVVLLIDRSSGQILTACRSNVTKPLDGIENVTKDSISTDVDVTTREGIIAVKGVFECVSVLTLDGICVAKIIGEEIVSVPSGVYILHIINGKQTSTSKISVR